MEGYLRLGLLVIAAIIVLLILFEARYRRHQARLANLLTAANKLPPDINPDEVLGLDAKEPVLIEPLTPPMPLAPSVIQEGVEKKVTSWTHEPTGVTKEVFPFGKVVLQQSKEPEAPPAIAPLKSSGPLGVTHRAKFQSNNKPVIKDTKDLLMLSVHAKAGEQFASYELMQAISATGMEFGDMNIFHFYIAADMKKIPLFSLVSATEPGDFDLDRIGDYSCIGLMLFTNLREVPDPQEAFDLMLEVAQQLSDDLDGELRAGYRTPWTAEAHAHYQKKVLQYQAMKYA